ncbi:TRAP transporter substrate-binding protein [uncultured Methylibium sp.]|uniref:TRAP transporter substrate-binding protein n=1 Tax=uncultured Methylibium sp. TaxID=381093 RepID=UPI0025F43E32|nr:TRAP transporter substrate-binding protein [uncultured Methylibium sp.]
MNLIALRRGCAALALPLLAGTAFAQDVTLKVHHFWPPQAMPPTKILAPWCERIAADSGGRMKCQVFPAMQLGGTPSQLIDQAKDGVVDIAFTLPGYTAGRFPVMEVFELPFLTNSAEAAARAAWDFYGKYGTKEFAGIKPLMFSVHDEGYLHTRDKQVKALADLKGMKLRAPTRMTNKLLAALGATPVAMPLPAVPEAVSKGVIDGFLLPWEVIPSVKLHEMVKYHTETDAKHPALYSATFILAMNQARYDGLPADLKAIIDKHSGAGLSAQAGKIWDESQAVGRKPAVDRNNTFYTLPSAETDLWVKASAPLYDEWVANMDKAGLPGRQMLQDARQLLQKYAK